MHQALAHLASRILSSSLTLNFILFNTCSDVRPTSALE